MHIDTEDVAPLDRPKATAAAGRLRIAEITDPDGAAFDDAYVMLDGFFAPKGELEERSVLARFVRDRLLTYGEGLTGSYHLVGAWDGDRLVGVRDCYVDVDEVLGLCLVALSHSYVVPEHRRTGLGALFRALPLTLARRALAERYGRALPTLVAAEMELYDPARTETLVRLIAYGRSGFGVLDPQRFRYAQPDFGARPDAAHTGIAMLGVVRAIGLPQDAVPVEVAAAFPRLFHVCHRMYLPRGRVDPSEVHALATLLRRPEPVRILPLPTGPDELDRLAPLVREVVLPLYPPGLRGPMS